MTTNPRRRNFAVPTRTWRALCAATAAPTAPAAPAVRRTASLRARPTAVALAVGGTIGQRLTRLVEDQLFAPKVTRRLPATGGNQGISRAHRVALRAVSEAHQTAIRGGSDGSPTRQAGRGRATRADRLGGISGASRGELGAPARASP